MYARCMISFAHILDLMVLSLFLFNKIRISIALFLSSFVILLTLIDSKTTQSWRCCIYLCAAAIPFYPDFLMTCFNLYVWIKLQDCKSSIPDKVVFMCIIFIATIYSVSEMYSSICSALACKCFQLFGGTLTLPVRRLSWFSYSSSYLSSASIYMSSSSSGS